MPALISKKNYTIVWLTLLGLLTLTWVVSRIDLKAFNIVLALSISVIKMVLILLYFMHLRYSSRLVWVIAAAGFVWLVVLLDLTLSDYLTRGSSWSR